MDLNYKSNKNSTINHILSSLTLDSDKLDGESTSSQVDLPCLKCDITFEFPNKKDDYLAHLFLIHRLIIADVEEIADLKAYLLCWHESFKDYELEHYCTTMLLDQLPDGTPSKNEKYYLLSDILPQDYDIRERLHMQCLEKVLTQHQFERTDRNFSRECLHCRDIIKGLRSDFVEHLYKKHFVHLGKSENLVYVDELIDTVQSKLENLICLYCEKVFKDRSTLKEHMRKKGHKRINPDIKFYDKFFLINYKTEKPKRVKNFKGNNINQTLNSTNTECNSRHLNSDEEESDWSDWDGEKRLLTCLFCVHKDADFKSLKTHMLKDHCMDFEKDTGSLNFYEKIKVVNYVRRQMHILHCVSCDKRFDDLKLLADHLRENQHYGIGVKKQWDKPEYFFPTYEDDELLCHLDNENDDLDEKVPVLIYSEDSKADINKDAENLSLENFEL